MSPLKKIEVQLRTAVESKQYLEVQRLVVAYCAEARNYAIARTPGDPEVQETLKAVHETLEWTRRMLQSGRESIALDLSRLPRVKRYLQTPPAAGSGWHVEV